MAAAQRIVGLSASDLADGLKSNEIKQTDLLEAAIARFDDVKFAKLTPPQLTPADARERLQHQIESIGSHPPAKRPPLTGVPFLVSDTINTAGLPTTASNLGLVRWSAARDAAVVARLRNAGALFMTKTSVHELSLGCTTQSTLRGAAENPWSAQGATTGGAAGGAAAAVAARVAPLALAVDSTGDARSAAACCGTVAYRPSASRYPTEGVLLSSSTLDAVAVLARTVEDVALIDTSLCKRAPEETMDEVDKAEAEAAVRIQAVARAKRDRARVTQLREEQRKLGLSRAAGEGKEEEEREADPGAGAEESKEGGEEAHLKTYGEAEAEAATRVQAIIRGKQGRTRLRAQLEQQAQEREKVAAVRIQSIARGRMTRKKVTELQTRRAGAAEARGHLKGARIGVDRASLCSGADPCILRAFDEACAKLTAAGAVLVDIKLPSMPEVGRKLGLDSGDGAAAGGGGSAAGAESKRMDPSFQVLTDDTDGFAVPAVASKVCEVIREHELLRELGTFIAQHRLDEDREVVDDTPKPKGAEDEEEEEEAEEDGEEGAPEKPKMMTIRTTVASVVASITVPSEERAGIDRSMRPVHAIDRASYLYALVHAREAVRIAVEDAMKAVGADCLLYPACLVPAAACRGHAGQTVHCGGGITSCVRAYHRNASLAPCLAGPAVTIPCGFARTRRTASPGDPGSERVPVAMELLGAAGQDDRVLELAAGLEACMPRLPDPVLRGGWRTGVLKHA